MIFNILGVIAGPLMIKSGIGLLVGLCWIWTIAAIIGWIWFLIAVIAGLLDR